MRRLTLGPTPGRLQRASEASRYGTSLRPCSQVAPPCCFPISMATLPTMNLALRIQIRSTQSVISLRQNRRRLLQGESRTCCRCMITSCVDAERLHQQQVSARLKGNKTNPLLFRSTQLPFSTISGPSIMSRC